jgi:hypothetical protein
MVYESTADGFVSENALAGAIPTEIGQLTQLTGLSLSYNQLTGASENSLHCNFGIRVYRNALCEKMRWCQPAQRVQCELTVRRLAAPVSLHRPRRVQDAHEADGARLQSVPVIARQPGTLVQGRARNASPECVEA